MAIITDLTWQQVETASTISNLIITDSTQGILLRMSALTGIVTIDKNTTGVVQALYRLREYCAVAQQTVNVNQSIGTRFAAFPQSVTGNAINGYVVSSGQIITRIPVSTNGILGAVN